MSELTQRQLQEISKHLEEHLSLISEAEMERDQQTYCTFRPSELHSTKEAIDELLALRSRDAGDEEVDLLHEEVGFSFGNPYRDQQKKSREALENLRHIAIARGQREAKAIEVANQYADENLKLSLEVESLKQRLALVESEIAGVRQNRDEQLREARDELVGLLKYLFRNQDLQSDRAILSDESRRILEIVEGK